MLVSLSLALALVSSSAWTPFSSNRAVMHPPSIPPSTQSAQKSVRCFSWRQAGKLNCPWGGELKAPLCGSILDLVVEGKEDDDNNLVLGRAVICAKDSVAVSALWNAEIEDTDYPHFQNSRETDSKAFDELSKTGYPLKEWVAELQGTGEEAHRENHSQNAKRLKKRLTIGGLERIAGIPKPLVLCNGLQSNFMAPFDFIIADGRVIRQAYAKEMDMWAFPKKGTLCWAMQLAGEGGPRIVSVCVGEGDLLLGQAPEPLLPHGFLTERWEQGEPGEPKPFDGGVTLLSLTIVEGVSGLPLLMNGMNMCAGLRHCRPLRPIAPNELLWDPAQTRAAFTAIATLDGKIVLCSVTEEMTVSELASTLKDLGVKDALLLGGSGDVSLWVNEDSLRGGRPMAGGNVIHGPARKGGTRNGLFLPGERPLNCVVMAHLR